MALLKEDLNQIIKSIVKSDDFEFISYENSNLEEQEIGFQSDQWKKCIKYKHGDKVEQLFVFIKQLPISKHHRRIILHMGSFARESLVLGEILLNFDEYSIPIPKCYLSKDDGTIVLQDICVEGYRNRNLTEPLDFIHCQKALEALAKFHAASFIVERKKKFKINEKYPIIETEVLLHGDPDHPGTKCTMAGIKAMREITKKYLTQYPTDVTEEALNYIANIFDKFGKSNVFPNALSHSDMWGNNIMYKYDKRGDLQDALLLDFQLTTYKPPAFDILCFLHICTSKEFRDNNNDKLSKHYFSTLSQQLARSNIDLTSIMSYTDFEESLKAAYPAVIAKTPIYLTFVLMPPELIKDAMESGEKFEVYFEEDRIEFSLRAMEENAIYHKRNLEGLKELYDYFLQCSR